jgi:CRP-like cAMP-binding protein
VLRKDGKIELLKTVPLFSACNKKQLGEIAQMADIVDLPSGTELIREGASGREFMVIVSGSGEVRRKGRKIATIGPGDFIGEMALIMDAPRNATVKTTSDTTLLAVTTGAFWRLLRQSPDLRAKVMQAMGERLRPMSI